MALDWSTIKGVTISEGVVTKIEDSEGRVIWKKGDKVIDVKLSEYTSWIITEDGTLYGCGSNNHGQQGSGDKSEVRVFTRRLTNVKCVECSNHTTWALIGTTWYGCGRNDYGQQGSGDTNDVLTFTARFEHGASTSDGQNYGSPHCFACSEETTWAIDTRDYTLWGCGHNNYGQQGTGDTNNVLTFTKKSVATSYHFFYVFCSSYTTWAIGLLKTDYNQGKVYGCGYNNYGQQGSGDTNNVLTLTSRFYNSATQTTRTPVYVACTPYTTYIRTSNGEVHGCGDNSKFQMGKSGTMNTFTKLSGTKNYAWIACSMDTAWFIDTSYVLYGCGSDSYGQQGSGTASGNRKLTQRLTDVRLVSCSRYATYAIRVIGDEPTTLWSCGRSNYGQQGTGNTDNVLTFTQMSSASGTPLSPVTKIRCVDESMRVISDNVLFACGWNANGSIGDGTTANVLSPKEIEIP